MSATFLPAGIGSMASRGRASRRGLRYVAAVSLIVVLIGTPLASPLIDGSTPLTVTGAILDPASRLIPLSYPREAEPRSAVAPMSDQTTFETVIIPVPLSAAALEHPPHAGPIFGIAGTVGGFSLPSCAPFAHDAAVTGHAACSGIDHSRTFGKPNTSGHLIEGVADFAVAGRDSLASSTLTVGTPVPSPSSIDLGQTVNFTSTVSGGSGGNVFVWKGLPAGCSSVNKTKVSCTPSVAGNSNITLTVTDSNRTKVTSGTLSFTTHTDPKISSFGASPGSVPIGTATTITASVTGGRTPDKYSYSGLPKGCSSRNAATLRCTPSTSGTFTVHVSVVDANGRRVSQSAPLTVTSPARVLGLPPDQGYAVIVGGVVLLAALVAIVALAVSRRRKRRKSRPKTPPTQRTAAPEASTGAPRSQQNPPPPDGT